MSQLSRLPLAGEIKQNKSWAVFLDTLYLEFLIYDTPYSFAYISALWYRTEIFLHSRRAYGSHLSNEICTSRIA